jgi:3-hydroxyisobutyrate dehydrogenase-like beta-hydroxyacid dehydrogenase
MRTIGVLGMGIVGSRVAANYRAAGFSVKVWSRTARAMEGFLDSPRAVAEASEVVQLFVLDGVSLLSAVQEMEPVLTADHVVINSATVSLEATQAAAEIVTARGAKFLDAPFTGSRDAAGSGQLVYYIGGDSAVLEQVREVLEKSSKDILHLGAIGDATVLKLVTNMVSATTLQSVAEAMAVTSASGIPLDKFLQAMEGNANCSGLVRMKVPSMIRRDYTPHFSLKNMLKDSRFALELAKAKQLRLPALESVSQVMTELNDAGKGEQDYSVLAANYLS